MSNKKGLSFSRKRRKVSSDVAKEILNYLLGITVAIVIAFFLSYNWGVKTSVIGVSMENTLYSGQTILISRLSYLILKPRVGDVVVFKPNGNQNTHYYVKRVVAVPGDTVEFRDGRRYVNGKQEQSGFDKVADPGIVEAPLVLGIDEYFVLGDNRNNSEDSRSGNIGPVSKKLIEGRAWFKMTMNDSYMGFIDRY